MKNAVFWDIKPSSYFREDTLRLRYRAQPGSFEVLTAVTKKNAVFSDVTLYGSCRNRRFGRTYRFHHQGDKNWRARNNVGSN
jgi:hypothetical protein